MVIRVIRKIDEQARSVDHGSGARLQPIAAGFEG
jgi:hypothetical protein